MLCEVPAGSPTYIETAHRRGYRFIAKVEERPDQKGESEPEAVQTNSQFASDQVFSTLSPVDVLGREAELAKLQTCWDLALAGDPRNHYLISFQQVGRTLQPAELTIPSSSPTRANGGRLKREDAFRIPAND